MNLQYSEEKPQQPWLVFMRVLYLVELEFRDAGFCARRETGDSGEKPLEQGNSKNKLNPHKTLGLNQTRATFVGGERSYHCAIPVPQGERSVV